MTTDLLLVSTSAVRDAGNDADAANDPMRTISTETLLRGQRAVRLTHLGTHYVLRVTRGGKLILTK